MVKPWYKSKVLWFNVLALVVFVAGAFGFAEFEAAPWVEPVGTVVVLIVNLVLRFVTDKKLARS